MNDETAGRNWCMTCGTPHDLDTRCPGDLPATDTERPGWTILSRTSTGPCRYQVLLAPSYDLWRARVRTFPNVLWLVPGGAASLKFVDLTRRGAERQAIEFIERHCRERGKPMVREAAALWQQQHRAHAPATRKIRFLPIRFGFSGPSERAGTGNLSETGMFVVTETPVKPGTTLRMVLEIEDRIVPLLGDVRWWRTENEMGGVPGMGIELREPPRPYLRFVRNLAA